MTQLYTHVSFSLPCLGLLAVGWSVLFHHYLPIGEALGWLGGMMVLLSLRVCHLRWRQRGLAQLPLVVLERELFIGVTISSIAWALGVLFYMDHLPDAYRAAMIMLTTLILTGSAIMLLGSRRALYGSLLPLGFAMLFELAGGQRSGAGRRSDAGRLSVHFFAKPPASFASRADSLFTPSIY